MGGPESGTGIDAEIGTVLELEIERVAHGGHCVARVEETDGRKRVVFVRHALPGELVRAVITEVEKSFLRADAIDILNPSPDRVEPPCLLAHPDGCGGCDFQHATLPAQRGLKESVIAEQFSRLAGMDVDVTVEEVQPTLRWRTRMQYVQLPGGRRGLRKHRSHAIIEVDDCLIAAPDARDAAPSDRTPVSETVLGHSFQVAGDGFWQVHPEAPRLLVETVMSMLTPQPGERALDLYAGVGLFSSFLAEAVGASGHVTAVEGNRAASRWAAENLKPFDHATVRCAPVERSIDGMLADIVVLDPPRAGAKRKVVEAIAALRPRAVAYVACDPAALARDVSYFAEAGYATTQLRAFDLFPMTHHVECVALLAPTR
ncbi:MAG TPA: TRAM domain-containing protein [Aeromicrobium sp.]|nr:TRAM domain-containing protein [Aeromicrobium sp.]